MKPATIVKTRWERRKDARPQELLAAALDLFVENGYAATRLEDIAKCAGVSKGTLYLYFSSKEELFRAVVRENLLPLIGEAEQELEQYQGSSTDLFRDFMLAWWERIGDTKLSGISKLMMSEAGNFPEIARFYHTEIISRGKAIISRLLERGIASGEFRNVPVVDTTQIVLAPVLMLMLWKHFFSTCQIEPISSREYLESFIDVFLHGLLSTKPTDKQ